MTFSNLLWLEIEGIKNWLIESDFLYFKNIKSFSQVYSSVPNNCAPVPNNRAVVFWLFLLFYCTYKSKSCPSLSLDQDLSSEWLRAPQVYYMKEKITLHYYYQPAQLLGTLEYMIDIFRTQRLGLNSRRGDFYFKLQVPSTYIRTIYDRYFPNEKG